MSKTSSPQPPEGRNSYSLGPDDVEDRHEEEEEDQAPAVDDLDVETAIQHGEPVATFTVVPPDGGWGWVIVAASFFCNLVVDGIIFAFGMFLNDIAVAFDESKAKVSIIGSLLAGFYLMVGE